MRFVPVPGTGVRFSIWETRVGDFEAFARATGHRADGKIWTWQDGRFGEFAGFSWRNPGFTQTADHPVCAVSWDEAQAFCRWLTTTERAKGWLGPNQRYRLPTDAEWSVAVGLPHETGATPADKDDQIKAAYPWGTTYPPHGAAGNYADRAWDARGELADYDDGYQFTAPVGSYAANRHGIFDLGGNVWEWCEDRNSPDSDQRVLRGASFSDRGVRRLLSSDRLDRPPAGRYVGRGFRVVLAVDPAP